MAASSPSESGPVGPPRRPRWGAFQLTQRSKRQLLRGLVVSLLFTGFSAALALLYGVRILQYTIAGFIVSSIVMVAAIGLTLIYGIRGFANFAYGDLMTLGAYVALFVNLSLGQSLFWGAAVAFVVLALLGVLLEVLVFSRFEGRGAVPPIVASVGVGLIIQNGINATATTQQWNYAVIAAQEIPIVPGLGIHPIRGILTLIIGIGFMMFTQILLKYTNLGKAMRATADNLELAKATGIDTRRVTYAAWAVSCSFASTAGVLLGLAGVVRPLMGFQVLLLVFAAVIVGGIGSPYGAVLGSLVIGLSQEMSVPLLLWLGRPDVIALDHADAYKIAIPFLILIGVLLFRPSGIAGRQAAIAPRGVVTGAIVRALAGRWPRRGLLGANRRG